MIKRRLVIIGGGSAGMAAAIKAVKKRTRAGFGKCQGGFCQPLVSKIISEKFDIPLNKVLFQKEGSFVMPYKTKGETK